MGIAASTARLHRSAAAPDMRIIATEMAVVSGFDHCQPMVSCDHRATPRDRNTPEQVPERRQAGPDLVSGIDGVAGEPGRDEPRQHAADGHVGVAAPRIRPLADVRDEQFGELIAVPGPPVPGVPAEQAGGAPGRGLGPVAHAAPQPAASRRSPSSATRRWASR